MANALLEQLVDENNALVANATGITALVFTTLPTTAVAPNKVVTGVTTDASGNASVDVTGLRTTGQTAWLALMKDGTPALATFVKATAT